MKTSDLIAWLSGQIKTLPAGTMLSTDNELARQWGVSVRTVRRAMARFAADAQVTRRQGAGTFVGAPSAPSGSAAKVHSSAVDQISTLLMRMISEGTIRSGQFMPSIKFLRLTLKASEHTIARALQRLENQKSLTRVGRNYRVGNEESVLRVPLKKEIVFIQRDNAALQGIFTDRFLGPAFQKAERELRALGCNLVFLYVREVAPLMKTWFKPGKMPFGLFFHQGGGQEAEIAAEIVRQAKRIEAPAPRMLIDSTVSDFRDLPDCFLLHRGNLRTAAARTVGAFVAAKRYPCLALIMDTSSGNPRDYFWGNQKFLGEARRHMNIPVRQCIALAPGQNAASVRADIDREGEEYYREYLSSKYGAVLDERFWSTVSYFTKHATLPMPEPNELWIAPTAQHAVTIIETFAKKDAHCPKHYSLLCLDDNPMQYHHGLSVCILDWDKAGYLMAHALIGDVPVKKSSQGYLSLGWDIIERKTT